MTRRGPTIAQRVWDSKQKVYRHRIVRQFIRRKLGSKRKPSAAEALFARA